MTERQQPLAPSPALRQLAEWLAAMEEDQRRLAGNIALEIRTRLTSLTGFLDALEDGIFPPNAATFDRMRAEAERLLKLADELTRLAQGERIHQPERLLAERPGYQAGPLPDRQSARIQTGDPTA